MGIHDAIERCERNANTVETEMPEFAKVLREAADHMRSWDD